MRKRKTKHMPVFIQAMCKTFYQNYIPNLIYPKLLHPKLLFYWFFVLRTVFSEFNWCFTITGVSQRSSRAR